MTIFAFIFLSSLILGSFLQIWLTNRQIRHVKKNKDKVPEQFKNQISTNDHYKAAEYSVAKLKIQKFRIIASFIILLVWTFGGLLAWTNQSTLHLQVTPIIQGIVLILIVVIAEMIIDLPLELYSTFRIESKFGFNRTTPSRFLIDKLLQILLFLALGLPLLFVMLTLMSKAGIYWWVWAWAVWMAFLFFITWAFPTFIAPLFNKFKPLDDVSLKRRLEGLLKNCGFKSNGMYVMDGSKRSSHGNAYFTGLGKNKRIVFFDTLLEGLNENQIEAVLAHELGHFKHKHISKMIKLNTLISFLGLALLGWLCEQKWFFLSFGIQNQNDAISLMLFFLIIPVFTIFLTPLKSRISRKHEFEADNFAAETTNAKLLIEGLIKMYKDNASTVTSDPFYSAFYYSHPSATDRVANLIQKENMGVS